MVVSDPKHPENEGKVFLFKFGKKIFDKITEAMQQRLMMNNQSTHLIFGKVPNFKLKIRKVDGYWNYDKSEFESVSQVAVDDEKIKAIWKQQHALKPFVDLSNFKTYDELKEKLNRVITGDRNASTVENVNLPPQTNGKAKAKLMLKSKLVMMTILCHTLVN